MEAPTGCTERGQGMSWAEYAFSVGCLLAIVCMVVIELKPRASAAFSRALSFILAASLAVLVCIMVCAVWNDIQSSHKAPTPTHYDLDTLNH